MKPEDLTNDVWDYVFMSGPQPQHSAIPAQTLVALRREFEFWYPFDLRVGPHNIFFCLTIDTHQPFFAL